MSNSLTLKQAQQKALQLNSTLAQVLNTSNVKDITTASLKLNTALSIADKTKLPTAKLFSIIKNDQLYKKDKSNNKNFEEWAKAHYDLEKASVFKYAKAGDFVNEDGFTTVFAKLDKDGAVIADFDYTKLINIIELASVKEKNRVDLEKTKKAIEKLINDGIIDYTMTVAEIKKALKYKPENDLNNEDNNEDKGEDKDEVKGEDKDEDKGEEYNPLNPIKDTNLYKFALSIFDSALLQLFNDNATQDIFTVLEYMQNIAKGNKEQEQQ